MFRMTCRRSTFRAEEIFQESKPQTMVADFLATSVLAYQITSQDGHTCSHVCVHLISRVTQGISSLYLLITVERGRRACKVKFVEGVERLWEARSVSCCLARGEAVGEGG
jgi:hypothetical protein